MYQLNDTEIWREYRYALLREAEEGYHARRLKEVHSKREGSSYVGKIRRRATLMLSTMGLAVLLAAGVAYALDIQCQPGSSEENPCVGTDARDTLTGTEGDDFIEGRGSNDVLRGLGGDDFLAGDGAGVSLSRQTGDELFGGPGNDTMIGNGGSDLYSGGGGADVFAADNPTEAEGVDAVNAGRGNDTVNAEEGQKDVIDCGRGTRDEVTFDAGIDQVKNCEIKNPL
jgi:hypothetical protein